MMTNQTFPCYKIIQNDDANLLKHWITEHPQVVVHARNGLGENILEMAVYWICPRVLKLLLESKLNLRFGRALEYAVKKNSDEMVTFLLKTGAPAGGDDGIDRNNLPLFWAIRQKNMSMGCQLLEAGASNN
jgi:ankyrin repeat protein